MKKILNFILGMIIIFLVQYFCAFILDFLKINFPAPILGIILLFALLKFNLVKENWIKDFAQFLIKHMILFFIPIFVGIVSYGKLLQENLYVILLTIFLTTFLMIVFVGLTVENIIKFKRLQRLKRRTR